MEPKRSMTSDGVLREDWDKIHEIAANIVNASAANDEVSKAAETSSMHETLDWLLLKYGDKPSLLSTKADYLEDAAERIFFHEKAYHLADQTDDFENKTIISWSLAEAYWEDLRDKKMTARWLATLRECLKAHPDDYGQKVHDALQSEIDQVLDGRMK